jgi:hypothetical protein
MLEFLLYYVSPFVLAALLFLLWAYSANKLKERFPRYYKVSGWIYDKLPYVGAAIVIMMFLYYYWGIDYIIS